jgi:hypothetical protein
VPGSGVDGTLLALGGQQASRLAALVAEVKAEIVTGCKKLSGGVVDQAQGQARRRKCSSDDQPTNSPVDTPTIHSLTAVLPE